MSWSYKLCIGNLRPWPEAVYVICDRTDETRRYVPEKYSSAMQCLASIENVKLRELAREMWHELNAATQYEAGGSRGIVSEFAERLRELGIEVNA